MLSLYVNSKLLVTLMSVWRGDSIRVRSEIWFFKMHQVVCWGFLSKIKL